MTRSGKFIYENMLPSNKLAATLNIIDIIWPNYPAEYYIPILLYVQYNTRILTKHFFGHKTSVVESLRRTIKMFEITWYSITFKLPIMIQVTVAR